MVPHLLHFNSYRTVQVDKFKSEVSQALMGSASLFEGVQKTSAELVLTSLNQLVNKYVGSEVEVEQLGLSADNTIDIRIKANGGKHSFSFNGLSSGQKEIISTLFLIWRYTQNKASLVFLVMQKTLKGLESSHNGAFGDRSSSI